MMHMNAGSHVDTIGDDPPSVMNARPCPPSGKAQCVIEDQFVTIAVDAHAWSVSDKARYRGVNLTTHDDGMRFVTRPKRPSLLR